jgi:hypothetical protein
MVSGVEGCIFTNPLHPSIRAGHLVIGVAGVYVSGMNNIELRVANMVANA